jgi:phosphatidylglycerophosphatase A
MHLSKIIATFFGIGYVPFAPGTVASIVSFPFYFLMTYLFIKAEGGVSNLASTNLINILMIFIVLLFFVGIWASQAYSIHVNKEDPKEVVIDEVVGQLLTICLITLLLPYVGVEYLIKIEKFGLSKLQLACLNLFSAFLLFRIFDIAKPWPIDFIEKKYKGGLGIMLDDVMAAIFAVFTHFFILYAIIDRL